MCWRKPVRWLEGGACEPGEVLCVVGLRRQPYAQFPLCMKCYLAEKPCGRCVYSYAGSSKAGPWTRCDEPIVDQELALCERHARRVWEQTLRYLKNEREGATDRRTTIP